MLILSPVEGGGLSMAPIMANLQAALVALDGAKTVAPKARKPRVALASTKK